MSSRAKPPGKRSRKRPQKGRCRARKTSPRKSGGTVSRARGKKGVKRPSSPAGAARARRSATAAANRGGRRRPSRGGAGRRRARSRRQPPRILAYAAEASFFVFASAIIFAAAAAFVIRELPSTDGLWRTDRAPGVMLIAADGAPVPLHGRLQGAPARLADLPDHTPAAFLAIEDRNFYHHIGVNPFAIARALFVNASEGEIRQGGSTITQQLAKNLFLSADKTAKRKLQEMFLAFWLETRFTKDELLTLYLNRMYFGAGAYGIDAASRRYFGKPPQSLTLAESAILAGLLKAPSRLAPDRDPASAGARARLVIESMLAAGFIDEAAAREAIERPVRLQPGRFDVAPYFVDYALAEARALAPGAEADLEVRTTLDPRLQTALEDGVAAGLALADVGTEIEVAAVLLNGDGAVLGMVGGRDYARSQFNRAVDARRQPGSAFKPFVYLAALEQGDDPARRLVDKPVTVRGWSPRNYKDRYYGEVSMAGALALSLNAATVRLQETTGRGAVRLAARRMGLDAPLSQGAALALGVDAVSPLELAAAYAPFANGGYRVRPHGVTQIRAADGRMVYASPGGLGENAASPRSIAGVDHMLRAVVEWGTGKNARLEGHAAAGKTGTTQGGRDAWFVGHAGGLAAAVWLGRDDNSPMGNMTGGTGPAIVWREVMTRALEARPPGRTLSTSSTSTLLPATSVADAGPAIARSPIPGSPGE